MFAKEKLTKDEFITDDDDILISMGVDADDDDFKVWYGISDKKYNRLATNYKKGDYVSILEHDGLYWNYRIEKFDDKKILLNLL